LSRYANLNTLLLSNLQTTTFNTKPTNLKVHNLCSDPSAVSPKILDALGLGLGFCVSLNRKDENPIDFDRFQKDVRTRYQFRNQEDSPYNAKLYVKSEAWEPEIASPKIETAMNDFQQATREAFKHSRRLTHEFNLPPKLIQDLRRLKKDRKFTVTGTDKNLGTAIMETSLYYRRALDDHLLNTTNYEEITADEAFEYDECNYRRILRSMVDAFDIDAESKTFFTRTLCGERNSNGVVQRPSHIQLPYFYLLPKIHKKPWKTRPVVSGVSSVNEPLSKWIDYHLQQVLHLCPAYLKDSWQLLRDLKTLPPLADDTVIYSADAVAMYSNIDNDLGIDAIRRWLDLHAHQLPAGFPVKRVLAGLDIVMRTNIFTFGNRYWRQRNGTAMGTPCACAYATIYYSYHEETVLITADNPHGILFYRRLIDDALIIQRQRPGAHTNFLDAMNSFGAPGARLEWEPTEPGRSVTFLDFTLQLNNNHGITTTTFQKPMNLYLYRPPSSAQPPSILYGLIYGSLHRYFWQNSNKRDFERFATLLFHRLQARGHASSNLSKLFLKAAHRVDRSSIPAAKTRTNEVSLPDGSCFLHVPFHPQDTTRRELQSLFTTSCKAAFHNDDDNFDMSRLIIAYSRAPNISDLVRRNRLGTDVDTTL
jgi:hypothetical protein